MYNQLMNFARRIKSRLVKQVSQDHPIPLPPISELANTLKDMPRFTSGQVKAFGWNIQYVDAPALISCIDVQIVKGWNDFVTTKESPLILDCGANIGISVLRYKQLYPDARIIAFEPDRKICEVLQSNIKNNDLTNIEVIEAAVWVENGQHSFFSEGADGSKLIDNINSDDFHYLVKTVKLADYLTGQEVDFLKLDIEGAELPVLESCQKMLKNVNQMVIEVHYHVNQVSDLRKILEILESADFQVSINLIAPWIDLRIPFEAVPNSNADQYLLICAWRNSKG